MAEETRRPEEEEDAAGEEVLGSARLAPALARDVLLLVLLIRRKLLHGDSSGVIFLRLFRVGRLGEAENGEEGKGRGGGGGREKEERLGFGTGVRPAAGFIGGKGGEVAWWRRKRRHGREGATATCSALLSAEGDGRDGNGPDGPVREGKRARERKGEGEKGEKMGCALVFLFFSFCFSFSREFERRRKEARVLFFPQK